MLWRSVQPHEEPIEISDDDHDRNNSNSSNSSSSSSSSISISSSSSSSISISNSSSSSSSSSSINSNSSNSSIRSRSSKHPVQQSLDGFFCQVAMSDEEKDEEEEDGDSPARGKQEADEEDYAMRARGKQEADEEDYAMRARGKQEAVEEEQVDDRCSSSVMAIVLSDSADSDDPCSSGLSRRNRSSSSNSSSLSRSSNSNSSSNSSSLSRRKRSSSSRTNSRRPKRRRFAYGRSHFRNMVAVDDDQQHSGKVNKTSEVKDDDDGTLGVSNVPENQSKQQLAKLNKICGYMLTGMKDDDAHQLNDDHQTVALVRCDGDDEYFNSSLYKCVAAALFGDTDRWFALRREVSKFLTPMALILDDTPFAELPHPYDDLIWNVFGEEMSLEKFKQRVVRSRSPDEARRFQIAQRQADPNAAFERLVESIGRVQPVRAVGRDDVKHAMFAETFELAAISWMLDVVIDLYGHEGYKGTFGPYDANSTNDFPPEQWPHRCHLPTAVGKRPPTVYLAKVSDHRWQFQLGLKLPKSVSTATSTELSTLDVVLPRASIQADSVVPADDDPNGDDDGLPGLPESERGPFQDSHGVPRQLGLSRSGRLRSQFVHK